MTKLRIAFLNINTYSPAKYPEIRHLLAEYNIDILILSDTRYDNPIPVPFYTTHHKGPPRTHNRVGGFQILVKHGLQACPTTQIDNDIHINDICQTILVTQGKHKILKIVALYLPPRPDIHFPQDYISEQLTDPTPILILGDMNAKHTDFGDSYINHRGRLLSDLIQTSHLSIVNTDEPTFINHLGCSRIDLMVVEVNDRHLFKNFQVLDDISSDHSCIMIDFEPLNFPLLPASTRTIKLYCEVDWDQFNMVLASTLDHHQSEQLMTTHEIDKEVDILTEALQLASEQCIPEKEITPRIGYISEKCKHLIRLRSKLLKRKKRSPHDPQIRQHLNSITRQLRLTLQLDRKNFFSGKVREMLQKRESKTFWKLMSLVTGRYATGNPYISLINDAGQVINQGEEVAEIFVEQMAAISTSSVPDLTAAITDQMIEDFKAHNPEIFDPATDIIGQLQQLHPNPAEDLTDEERRLRQKDGIIDLITYPEMDSAIRTTKNKAPGPDGIKAIILQKSGPEFRLRLLQLYNAILRRGYFPKRWKHAHVIMIHKPGKNKTDPKSYRPISLLNVLGKIFERIILRRLSSYLELIHFFAEHQSGFRRNRSTTTNLVNTSEAIVLSLHNKHKGLLFNFDAEKAFDKMWTDGVIYKLAREEIVPKHLCRLLYSFLSDRAIQVKANDVLSSIKCTTAGTPQGGVLSPLLYIIYVNDLQKETAPEIVTHSQFADDINSLVTDTTVPRLLLRSQRILNKINRFCINSRIKMNDTKTTALLLGFSNNPHLPPLQFGNSDIQYVSKVKLLGVHYDSNMHFNTHINEIQKEARSRMRYLRRLVWLGQAPPQIVIKAYKSFIRPMIEYACTAWAGNISKTSWKRLEAIQRHAMRTVLRQPRWCPSDYLYANIQLQPIKERLIEVAKRNFMRQNRGAAPSRQHRLAGLHFTAELLHLD